MCVCFHLVTKLKLNSSYIPFSSSQDLQGFLQGYLDVNWAW